MYQSPSEVLLGFDVDACSVGYDGTHLLATPRARRAIIKKANFVDLTRRSLTYESRLFKYSKRGFGVLLNKTFDPNSVPRQLLEKKPKELDGLAKLVVLSHIEAEKERLMSQRSRFMRRQARQLDKKTKCVDKQSDYTDVMLPPTWSAHLTVHNYLVKQDHAHFYASKTTCHRHIAADGEEGVLYGWARWCPLCRGNSNYNKEPSAPTDTELGMSEEEARAKYVFGKPKWVRENPGRQLLTGSFHPVTDDRWESGVPPSCFVEVPRANEVPRGGSPKAMKPPTMTLAKQPSSPQQPKTRPKVSVVTNAPPLAMRKIAAFDLDNTLIKTCSGLRCPRDAFDWVWMDNVLYQLKELLRRGYRIVIFTNQAGIELGVCQLKDIEDKVRKIFQLIGAQDTAIAFISTGHNVYRKPSPAMWNLLLREHCTEGIDMEQSFFCGDAAGRPGDFSSSDLLFARNIGVKFILPKTLFTESPLPDPIPSDKLEVTDTNVFDPSKFISSHVPKFLAPPSIGPKTLVLLVGYPGSGKSTYYRQHLSKVCEYINRDTLKTMDACVEALRKCVAEGKSACIDNLNRSREDRARFIKEAPGYRVMCIVIECPKDVAKHLNTVRHWKSEGAVPLVPEVVYKTPIEEPQLDEGCSVVKVPFSLYFDTPEDERDFRMFTYL
eukprot:Sspe_Gene.8210::Locus_2804_Transcript_1_1_Confidence_1.000_Length_3044::g.8210::m.8210/K08073/PNKP; bifunctional polynucleotide phosphatase/kinase